MADLQTDLPIRPFVASDKEHNVLRLHLSYNKDVKGPILYLQAGKVPPKEPGSVFSSFEFIIFGSPSARVVVERGWPRANAKRLAAAWDQVLAEIAGKRGEAYAAVLKVLEPVGSRLAGEEPVESVPIRLVESSLTADEVRDTMALGLAPLGSAPHVPLNQQLPGLDAALAGAIGTPAFLFDSRFGNPQPCRLPI